VSWSSNSRCEIDYFEIDYGVVAAALGLPPYQRD